MNGTPFAFYSNFNSLSIHPSEPQGAPSFACDPSSHEPSSRKRKNSVDDISPLVMKTRAGIGLEQEIVYDRTMTMLMAGQRRLLEEQRQREYQLAMQQQAEQKVQQQQQQQQQHISMHHTQSAHRQPQGQQYHKESPAEAMKRLFMAGKNQSSAQHPQTHAMSTGTLSASVTTLGTSTRALTFADCAGEINGCETNRIPGMKDRYQALITPCTLCRRPQCQFCAVNCAACQEMTCRACCIASYDKPEVEHHCHGCLG
ncbi:unnamed protein product [Mortierella alpina]